VPVYVAAEIQSVPANETVKIGVYIVDFNRIDVGAGSVDADFYLTLASDSPVTVDDIELMNGQIVSVSTIRDTPSMKEYRIIAVLNNELYFSRYPFDRHTLSVKLEPKFENISRMTFEIDPEIPALMPKQISRDGQSMALMHILPACHMSMARYHTHVPYSITKSPVTERPRF